MGGSPDAAAASLPYSPSSYVPSAQAAGGWQQSAPATTLSLTLVVLIGAYARCNSLCCLVPNSPRRCGKYRCNMRRALSAHPGQCLLLVQACFVLQGYA